jgi:hypothetical protein
MAKHARTTISVPSELKARMDAVDESVNWSAVACQAFELKLAEITKRKGAQNMEQAIQRLKASKRKFEDKRYEEGFELGKTWAMNQAEAEELQRLVNFKSACERDSCGWIGFFDPDKWDWDDACSPSERVAFVIGGNDHNGDREYAREFWEEVGLPKQDSAAGQFVRGFVDGALGVWYVVQLHS